MANMVKVTIDGIETQVKKDTSILDAASSLGIKIPSFCHQESVTPYGACRICIVEVDEGNRSRVVPSCVYPIRKPVTVRTDTDKVKRERKMLVQLELARCSTDSHVLHMAADLGVEGPHPRMTTRNEDCILCGLCVRVCSEVVGADAISFEGRGVHRKVVAPFDMENPDCIACGACAFVCPTGCIQFIEEDGRRKLPRWKRDVPLDQVEKLAFQLLPEPVQSKK